MLVFFVRFVRFLLVRLFPVLGPHRLEPLLEELFQIVLRDRVLMIGVGLGESVPEEIGHLFFGQLAVFIRVGLSEEKIDAPTTAAAAGHSAAEAAFVPAKTAPHLRAT